MATGKSMLSLLRFNRELAKGARTRATCPRPTPCLFSLRPRADVVSEMLARQCGARGDELGRPALEDDLPAVVASPGPKCQYYLKLTQLDYPD